MHANAYDATWKLDISKSEEELLKGMRKTTRYIIHQIEKNKDITVEKSEDLKTYQDLNREVGKRQKFVPFSDEYIRDEYEIFKKDGQALLLFGKYKNEVVAGALLIFYQGVGYYHQAASLSKYAKLSVPYLLQWEAIKEAKRRGCVSYDFWGYVDPKKNPNHPWAGPTLFKMGYGGEVSEYVRTQDYILSFNYWLTYIFEELRKISRRL
jgi:lipid II:glycine glycyltransferase (peptidoglycan interpeptide bridge formation enzyme)